MSIKQGVLTTAFFHEVKAKIVVESEILLFLVGRLLAFVFTEPSLVYFVGLSHRSRLRTLKGLLFFPVWMMGDLG